MKYKSSFLKILEQRGFIHQLTDEIKLDEYLCKGQCVAYIGFDCTASSLHVGSLIQLMMLRWFQKCGHQPIVLLGGGTTKIGDPSGKDSARPVLENKIIEKNKNALKIVFSNYLNFEAVTRLLLREGTLRINMHCCRASLYNKDFSSIV